MTPTACRPVIVCLLENEMHEYDDFMGDKRTEMMVLTVFSAIVIGVIYVGWRIYNG